jgi:hypothetical protein
VVGDQDDPMARVKVLRARIWDAWAQDYFVSTRMFTLDALKKFTTLKPFPGTEVEVDSSRLVPGKGCTERDFTP